MRRADFDDILFRKAAATGARTLEGCQVKRMSFDDEGATVDAVLDDGSTQRWRARFVVDASGRDTLLAAQNQCKQKNRKHNSAALFGHYRGAERLPGRREGNISIFWFQHGWFWFIPLADASTSVGAVCCPSYLKQRGKALAEFLADTIALAPELARRLKDATLIDGQVWATGNHSYCADRCAGERFVMLGDAYASIDPVFSSGVYLAMQSAFDGAEAVAAALDRPAAYLAACRRFKRRMRHGPRRFSWFIHRMTNPMMRGLFMHPAKPLRMQEAVVSLLAGDIHGKTPVWTSLALFKGVYHLSSLAALPRTWSTWRAWRAWRQRRQLIRDVGAVQGENVIVAKP